MSRCIREGVTYARHKNRANELGKMVCAACGHVKGTPSFSLLVDVKPEAPNDIAQTPSVSTEIASFENEGGLTA